MKTKVNVKMVMGLLYSRAFFIGSMLTLFFLVGVPFLITTYNKFFASACNNDIIPFKIVNVATVSCFHTIAGTRWYKILGSEQETDIVVNNKVQDQRAGIIIEASNDGYVPSKIKIGSGEFVSNWPFASTAAGSRILTRGYFDNDAIQQGIVIRTPYQKPFYLRMDFVKEIDAEFKNNLYPSIETGANRIWIWSVTALMALCILLFCVRYQTSKKMHWGLLATVGIFLLSFLFHERPYRGMGGHFDRGDDAIYLSYTQSIIKHGQPFVCGDYVKVLQAPGGCWQLPGAAYALLPGALLIGYMYGISKEDALDIKQVSGMRIMSMLYGMFATLLLFLSLHLIQQHGINVIFASFLIWGTSLSKWVFDRAIFTHSIEIFLLTLMLYVICRMFFKKLNIVAGSIILALTNGLMIFVRGEYILLLFAFPILAFILRYKKNDAVVPLKAIGAFYLASIPAYLFYQNVIAALPGYGTISNASVLSSPGQFFNMSFIKQYLNNSILMNANFMRSGLVIHVGVVLSAVYLLKKPLYSRLLLFSLVFTLMFYFSLMLFWDPFGFEWQHRYFVKLYPPLLINLALIFSTSGRNMKYFIWLVVIGSVLRQRYEFTRHVLTSKVEMFEPVYRYMTDAHLFLRGYEYAYMSNYFVILTIFFLIGLAAYCRSRSQVSI